MELPLETSQRDITLTKWLNGMNLMTSKNDSELLVNTFLISSKRTRKKPKILMSTRKKRQRKT